MTSALSSLKPLLLHAHHTGPNPYKVAVLLQLLGVPYEVRLWQFGDNERNGVKGGDFLAINENGRVPALEDPNTGVTSWESLACMNYLLRVYDREGRFGAGPTEQDRVDYDKWTALLVSTLVRFSYLFPLWILETDKAKGPMIGQLNWYLHYNATKNQDAVDRYQAQSYRCFDVLEGHMAAAKTPFILPHGLTAVDLHFYAWINQHGFAKLSLAAYPRIAAWLEQIRGMSEVSTAYNKVAQGKEM